MGHYNDFDLDVKKVQENGATQNPYGDVNSILTPASVLKCTEMLSCNGGCTTEPTCHASCGGLKTSCGGHCR